MIHHHSNVKFIILILLSFFALISITSSSVFINSQQEEQIISPEENSAAVADDQQQEELIEADLTSVNAFKRYPNGLIPSRIQVGKVVKRNPKHLKPGERRPPLSHREWIPFNPPLHSAINAPNVFVSLSEFATDHPGFLKIRVSVARVNNSGFEMVLGSWTEPAIPHVAASWIATDLPLWELQMVTDEQHLNEIEWAVTPLQFNPPLVDLMFDDHYSSMSLSKSNAASGNFHSLFPEGEQQQQGEEGEETELVKKKKSLLKAVAKLKAPQVVSGISKFEQRGDAHWTKLEVKSMSVTALGFTSVIRPWGDTPTFWVTAEHLATTLPPQFFRTGTFVVPLENSTSYGNPTSSGSPSRSNSNVEDNIDGDDSRSKSPQQDHQSLLNNTRFFGKTTIDFTQPDDGDANNNNALPPMSCTHPRVVVFIKCYDQAPPRRAIRAAPQNVNSKSFILYYDLRGATDSSQTKFTWVAIC